MDATSPREAHDLCIEAVQAYPKLAASLIVTVDKALTASIVGRVPPGYAMPIKAFVYLRMLAAIHETCPTPEMWEGFEQALGKLLEAGAAGG